LDLRAGLIRPILGLTPPGLSAFGYESESALVADSSNPSLPLRLAEASIEIYIYFIIRRATGCAFAERDLLRTIRELREL
jgi:hypothetical protein